MRRLTLALALLFFVGPALAGDKLADLAVRRKERMTKVERKKWDKALRLRVGKPPAPIVNVHNTWTEDVLVFDARPDASVEQNTWDTFLRCHFTDKTHHMDKRLAGVLVGAALRMKSNAIDIVSGFRAPKYNLMLRKKGHEVARESQHTQGTAVDFRLRGIPIKRVWKYVRSLKLGGVGFYKESAFVHADTGPIRFWAGR